MLLRPLAIGVGLLLILNRAQADARRFEFNLKTQDLSAALKAVASEANVKLRYAAGLLRGQSAPALHGRYSLREALDRLLGGTALSYQVDPQGVVTIKRHTGAAYAPSQDSDSLQLPPLTVTASSMPDYETSGYGAYSNFAATKTDTPLIETPISIQVVPNKVIEDRQVTRLQESLETVSGVVPVPSLGVGSRYLIRGFRQDRIYRDGLQSNGINSNFPTEYDTATAESIEVIKGPASVLYGRVEPGGLINITSKKPQTAPYHNLELQGGSFDYWRAEADSTGPLDEDGTWLYRLIDAWQKSDTFKDFGQDDRWLLAPSLTWRPSEATAFRVSVEYLQRDFQAEFGTPAGLFNAERMMQIVL